MMTRKLIIRTLLTVVLSAALLRAGEPWKEKPYTEWTQSDVARVLQESPWARSILFQGNLVVEEGQVDIGGPRVTIRWESALTVRQALVRQEELRGKPGGDAAARFLSATPAHHVIVMFGRPLWSFKNLTEEVVGESSYLELPRSKQKIKPLAVRFIRQGPQLVAIEFRFPRQLGDRPLIDAQQKKVSFYWGASTGFVSAEFDLSKMVRDGKLDL